ncbi:MAG: SRPBCC domain-containing protein [Verrucomicrobia bacterium]|nr:SRPBCC domain-containing protein [Verrucomicrobiota bacterium]
MLDPMVQHIETSRIFDAPIEKVWALWTDPELVKQWWGPDLFTCPLARIDFREGGTSLVSMKSNKVLDAMEHYTSWKYVRIVPLERIEFIQNLVDPDGKRADPTAYGLPADFPQDIQTRVTFKDLGGGRTEMTVEESAAFGTIAPFAKIGLEQSIAKMSILAG